MYESTAVLRSETLTFDQYLNEVPVYTDRTVFVRPKSVRMTEFYEAAKSGIHPEVVLVLSNPADYQGEKVAVYNGKEYTSGSFIEINAIDGSVYNAEAGY